MKIKKPSADYRELQSVDIFFNSNGFGEKLNRIKEVAQMEMENSVTTEMSRKWGTIVGRLRLVQEAMVDLLKFSNTQSEIFKNNFKQKQTQP